MITRRRFLEGMARGAAILAAPVAAIKLLSQKSALADGPVRIPKAPGDPKVRWGFLVDTTKCTGCGMCVQACKLENEVPLDAPVSRTWVERYILKRDGQVLADSPKAAKDGFTTSSVDIGEGKLEPVDPAEIEKAFFVPKLCNHCENPPCVQVCPVGATYQTADGVVLIDRKTCIGCGYCIMACPYGARFFHPQHNVAEKCTFCYHRISKGLKPACVDACPFGARAIGNLRDHDDPVTKAINTERVGVLKDEYGCKPQAYYIGLSKEVR